MANGRTIDKIERFSIYWVALDPTVGHEVRKTRPCVVVSPDELNDVIKTVIIAPFTSRPKHYSSRLPVTFKQRKSEVMLDQIRCVDKSRLGKPMGRLPADTAEELLDLLTEMFAP